jgi:hypothetical protein
VRSWCTRNAAAITRTPPGTVYMRSIVLVNCIWLIHQGARIPARLGHPSLKTNEEASYVRSHHHCRGRR